MTLKTKIKTISNCKNCGKITDREFCSDICEKVYNRKPKGAKPLQAVEEQKKIKKHCKNCGEELPEFLNASFCSAKCIKEYRFEKENPEKIIKDNEAFIENEESETPATDYMKRRKAEKEVEKKTGKKTKQKQIRNNEVRNNNDLDKPVFWMKGDGMVRREHNINEVKKLILSGLSYFEVIRIARKHFQSRTINEYYEIALDEVKAEKGESKNA